MQLQQLHVSHFTFHLIHSFTTSYQNFLYSPVGITTLSGGRVVNLGSGVSKITTASRSGQANVVTVNPKTLQLTAFKGSGGTTGMHQSA